MKDKRWFALAIIAIALVQGLSFGLPVMEVDAAQYAAMAAEMLRRGDWLHFYDRGIPYLDKPPLVFWTAGASFLLLGKTTLAFKLPSILFFWLGVYSTFRLTRLFCSLPTARLAALILATTQAGFLMVNDCKTDTLLMGAVAFATWQLLAFSSSSKLLYFFGSSVGLALAMLAKGPIGIMTPALALFTHFALRREWRNIFRWEWLALGAVTLLLLSPMLWGLYTQFDQHPEGVVNGKTQVSGLRFFFWTQSFGRITGESVWANSSGPDFFFHTTFWAFLPWSLLLGGALIWRGKAVWRSLTRNPVTAAEWLSWGGFVLTFIAMSASRFKLPHYIFVVFPLAAVLTAQYLEKLQAESGKSLKVWTVVQIIIAFTLMVAGGAVVGFAFPQHLWAAIALSVKGLLSLFTLLRRQQGLLLNRLVWVSVIGILTLNGLANLFFYPRLMEYQSTIAAGRWYQTHSPNEETQVWNVCNAGRALDFYADRSFLPQGVEAIINQAPGSRHLAYANDKVLKALSEAGLKVDTLATFAHFNVSKLNLKFIHPATRAAALQQRYWIEVQR